MPRRLRWSDGSIDRGVIGAEAALRASEARVQRTMAIQTVGVLVRTRDGTLPEANAAVLAMRDFPGAPIAQRRVTTQAMTLPTWLPRSPPGAGRGALPGAAAMSRGGTRDPQRARARRQDTPTVSRPRRQRTHTDAEAEAGDSSRGPGQVAQPPQQPRPGPHAA